MTVNADYAPLEYLGNGVAKTFPITWPFVDVRDVVVGIITGTTLNVISPANFTVVQTTSGGSVTLNTVPATGARVRIIRATPMRQPDVLRTGGEYSPRTVELMVDRAVMMIQQLAVGTLQITFDDLTGEFVWDAKGNRIIRVGDPVGEHDAVNLRSVLLLVEQIQSGGGSVSVSPKYWEFTGDGSETVFELPGADVADPLFYQVVINGLTKEPYDEYAIEVGTGGLHSLKLLTPPANGVEGWVILRGLARPAAGDLRRIPILNVDTAAETLNRASEFALLRCTAINGCALTIPPNQGGQLDFMTGSYFSVVQKAAQPVELVAGAGVEILVPEGYRALTRALNSVISATCESATADVWLLTGDLALAA